MGLFNSILTAMIIIYLFPHTIITTATSLKSSHSQTASLCNQTANHGHRPRVICRTAMNYTGRVVDGTPRSIIQTGARLTARHV